MGSRVGHAAEASVAWLLYLFFALLPLDVATAFGGWIGRTLGPGLRVSNNARRNLKLAYPDWNNEQVELIVRGMWENLGRTASEHPHLAKFDPYSKNSRVEVIGVEHCDLLKEGGIPGLFFAGHIANWEIAPLAATRRGLTVHSIYRRANNPYFNKLVQKGRNALDGELYPKGIEGAKAIIRVLKRGDNMAMLVDQKMNDGISVPFLGREAMTAPALAELALKNDCPIVPVRVERLKGAHFRVTFYPPLDKPNSGDKKTDILSIMTEVNLILSEWITEQPEQWLWIHNRWPDQ